MNLTDLLKDYAHYNLWANEQMLNWLYAKPAELLEKEIPSSFPSLRLTILHIWDAQHLWMHRLQGEFAPNYPSQFFFGSLDDLRTGLMANSQAFSDYVQESPDDFFQQSIHYQNTKGQTFTTPNAEVVLHCMQHSTYHRGQLVTMARGLGLSDPPQTDYIAYVRLREAH